MVGPTRSGRRDQPVAPRFELAVLKDGEADPAYAEVGVIHADALVYRRGVVGIGQVAGLGPLHQLDELGGMDVTAAVILVGLAAAGPPEIALVDVVVIGNRDAWYVPGQVAERPAPQVPLVEVVQLNAGVVGPGRAGTLVDLVAAEKQQVRLVMGHVPDNIVVGEPDTLRLPREVTGFNPSFQVVVAGKGRHDDLHLFHRVVPYCPGPGVPPILVVPQPQVIHYPVGSVPGAVPAVHAEGRSIARHNDLGERRRLPRPAPHDLQRHGGVIVITDGHHLGGQLEGVLVQSILGAQNRTADVIVIRSHFAAGDPPVAKPEPPRIAVRARVRYQRQVAHQQLRFDVLQSGAAE